MNPPGIILINPRYPHNVAATIRACSCFGVPALFWTGSRVDPSQYDRLPREERMKGYRDVTWQHSDRPFDHFKNGFPVCIEIHRDSTALPDFVHPENAIYVFGPEDGSVPQVIRRLCFSFVHIPSFHCLNLSAAVNVVLYDRAMKLHPAAGMSVAKHEVRGEIPVPGWDGRP